MPADSLPTRLEAGCLGGLLRYLPHPGGTLHGGFPSEWHDFEGSGTRATAHGIETMALDRFTLKRTDVPGLLLGFAAFDERQIRRGLEGLAAALDRRQGEAAG